MTRLPRLSLILLLAAGCGGGNAPDVVDARIGVPAGANGALYFTARGYGTADRLLRASTAAAVGAELHQTDVGADGTATMRSLLVMDLPESGDLVLEPGGLHVMLIGVDRLEPGAMVEVSLFWENAGEMTIEAVVVEVSETMDHDDG